MKNINENSVSSKTISTAKSITENARGLRRAAKAIDAYGKAGDGLSHLNTMRGGAKGFKGFAAEEMEAAEMSANGRATTVLNNNGIADLKHIKVDGTEALKQMKMGYKPGQIDFAKYKGQTVVIDKGNPYFKELKAEGAAAGVKVVKGHVSASEAKKWADMMQLETKITGSKSATITPKIYSGVKTAKAAHGIGIKAAKTGALSGAGMSLGSNFVEVARGNKTVGEAAGDVAIDTAKAGAISYGVGAATSVIGSTTAGAAALSAVGSAATAVSSAPVIGTAIGAAGTAAGVIGSVGTTAATLGAGALTSAVGTIGAAATTLASGTAAAGVVGAGVAAAAAGATAVGAAAIAAAPALAVGAVIGGLGSLIFGD